MSKAFTKSSSCTTRSSSGVSSPHPRAPPAPTSATERLPPSHRRESSTAPLDALPAPGTTDDGNNIGGGAGGGTIVCEVEGGLLMSSSTFPYFMLVALEAGGLLRGLLLLLLYPLLRLLTDELAMKAMAMVTFAGLRKDAFGRLGMAVMPKLFLQDVSAEVFHAATSAPTAAAGGARRRRRCVCVSGMPRAMVEPFLKEYLAIDAVVAPELRELGGYYLGLVEDEGEAVRRMDVEEVIGAKGGAVVGIGGLRCSFSAHLPKVLQGGVRANGVDAAAARALHPRRYLKPLVFHDGRTAFRPTPAATLAMFAWLPLGAPLALLRTAVFLLLPFSLSVPLLAALGMHNRMIASSPPKHAGDKSTLFACNHRSLLTCLRVRGRTARPRRGHIQHQPPVGDARADPHVPPHPRPRCRPRGHAGSACLPRRPRRAGGARRGRRREPFLLRFSLLFAELAAGGVDVVPVALHLAVDMFHGTTAGAGRCWTRFTCS
ncbi:hypothetical protein ZWY2020_018975 [Hordeum vulgare]|nr:hypothetical protein ZWY2020_018975 [Hordeum vulgare]